MSEAQIRPTARATITARTQPAVWTKALAKPSFAPLLMQSSTISTAAASYIKGVHSIWGRLPSFQNRFSAFHFPKLRAVHRKDGLLRKLYQKDVRLGNERRRPLAVSVKDVHRSGAIDRRF